MARIFIVHWKAAEVGPLLEKCRAAGFAAEHLDGEAIGIARAIRDHLPAAVVIDLSRLPSHGREMAMWLRRSKAARHIPIVFANGTPEKVDKTREAIPDGVFTTTAGVAAALKKVAGKPVREPVVPPPVMQQYAGRSAARKLGIRSGMTVGVVDPPRNFPDLLGGVPADVEFSDSGDVTLWFVHEPDVMLASLRKMRAAARGSKLWICRRKGLKEGVTERFVMESAQSVGLVDYKVCSVDSVWSALAFAVKKV